MPVQHMIAMVCLGLNIRLLSLHELELAGNAFKIIGAVAELDLDDLKKVLTFILFCEYFS